MLDYSNANERIYMDINQPRWKLPEYTKKQINNAGDIMRDKYVSPENQLEARKIIDNWRSAHAYPLHVFYINLRRKAGSRPSILVAERLKRLTSIIEKLQREKGMQLYRMQDLGGCRIVLSTLDEVYSFSESFKNSRIRHELINIKDYIQKPKDSGYRSLHLIYRFKTDTPGKEIYNQYPLLIELQFRTRLQHIWATALETIGFFTNQALKAGQGNESVLRFFVVVSSLFAIKENTPVVPGTIDDESRLISEIKQINDQHHVLDMLRAIRTVIDHDSENIPDKRGYYLLQLNYETHTLKRTFFKPSDLELANQLYDILEAQSKDLPWDIVLVRASSYTTVKAAYPNYFMDIGEFVEIITNYLK